MQVTSGDLCFRYRRILWFYAQLSDLWKLVLLDVDREKHAEARDLCVFGRCEDLLPKLRTEWKQHRVWTRFPSDSVDGRRFWPPLPDPMHSPVSVGFVLFSKKQTRRSRRSVDCMTSRRATWTAMPSWVKILSTSRTLWERTSMRWFIAWRSWIVADRNGLIQRCDSYKWAADGWFEEVQVGSEEAELYCTAGLGK